jgi:hypothetical protein
MRLVASGVSDIRRLRLSAGSSTRSTRPSRSMRLNNCAMLACSTCAMRANSACDSALRILSDTSTGNWPTAKPNSRRRPSTIRANPRFAWPMSFRGLGAWGSVMHRILST